MAKQWFKVVKFSDRESASISKKNDICCIEANNSEEGYNKLLEQLARKKFVECEFFSEEKQYGRSISQIINFIPITQQEAEEKRLYFKSL